MKAIILAGGRGTRLQPLTNDVPKPMLPLYEYPVIEYIVELLKKYGINEIGITLQYLPEQIMNYFGDGKKWDVSITYFIEDMPLGTAGGVKKADWFIEEECIIISGDAVTDLNLANVIAFHRQHQSEMTIVTKLVPDVTHYGLVSANDKNEVTRFIEKPKQYEATGNLINTGIYVIHKSVLNSIRCEGAVDFSFDVIPALLKEKRKVYHYTTASYWIDIGQLHHYRQAHYDLYEKLFGSNSLNHISETAVIAEDVKVIPPVYIGEKVQIRSGCTIGPWTVIGKNSHINSNATIRKSVLMNDVIVKKNCFLYDVALEHGMILERESVLLNDKAESGAVARVFDVKAKPLFSIAKFMNQFSLRAQKQKKEF
ncbi:NDP-sugar synthase [Bacillus sp. 1780r2a1]|uniref:nucleotidyltransferase family protein n=1 Tax=Priestia flexa TaxID=86664 RepID=UPI0022048A34|nr:NDP-sugar synthase [Bacillus sp. 1780r2a1]